MTGHGFCSFVLVYERERERVLKVVKVMVFDEFIRMWSGYKKCGIPGHTHAHFIVSVQKISKYIEF